MYNITYKTKIYTNDYYSDTIEDGLSILNKFGYELVSVGYAYKYLAMYWQIDKCIMSNGEYKSLKQLSLKWFKNEKSN
jgi:hypothetical protein